MPEGDSVYRFAARLRAALEGEPITAARAQGPGPVPRVELLGGAVCTGVDTLGKNLFIRFDNGLALRGHLRMYGTWHIYRPGEEWRKPKSQARLVLETRESVVVNFSAPVIELMEARAVPFHRALRHLGPDLLGETVDVDAIVARFRAPSSSDEWIGDAVMDQGIMAGVGNIWKHETLFRCRLNPWRKVSELSGEQLRLVVTTAVDLLRASVRLPGPDGTPGRRPSYYAYMRAGMPCRRCFTRLRTARQGKDIRYTTWCPTCQPGPSGPAPSPPGAPGRG